MFRKLFSVLLVLLMFINVPVYAQDEYTLKPGKVYRFEFDLYNRLDVDLSGDVLFYFSSTESYDELYKYANYGNSYESDLNIEKYMYVYNVSDSNVNLIINEGEIVGVNEYSSPFVMVMFDGSETVFELTNNSDGWENYKIFYYQGDGSLIFDSVTDIIGPGCSEQFDGIGALLLEVAGGSFEDVFTLNGVYEVGDYIRGGFFPVPPWILGMDLAGLLEAFWNQLQTLLPAALIVLSASLLISLAKYIVRLFL